MHDFWLVSVPWQLFWLVRVRYRVPGAKHRGHAVHWPHVSQQASAGQFVQVTVSLCGCLASLQLFCDPRARERVLVPLVVQDPSQAPQAPYLGQLSQHEFGQFVQVALWLCDCVAPLQLFCDPRARERVLVPLVVQEPSQAPQLLHGALFHAFQHEFGHFEHGCVALPGQSLPPLAGAGSLHTRVCVPLPHSSEHSPHSPHPPSIGQGSVLHDLEALPGHSLPPLAGAGSLHSRVCVPLPQVSEHSLHSPHPPSIAHGARNPTAATPSHESSTPSAK